MSTKIDGYNFCVPNTPLLEGRAREGTQGDLFREAVDPPKWAQVDLSRVRVERVRDFGKVYVTLALWRQLGLHQFFEEEVRRGREEIDWGTVACILGVGRFCDQGSEPALGERWYAHTALDDLLGVDPAGVYENRLYRGLDQLLPLRDKRFVHLRDRYRSLFGSRFEFLLYDVTSTYFEGQEQFVLCRSQARHEKEPAKCAALASISNKKPQAPSSVLMWASADSRRMAEALSSSEKSKSSENRSSPWNILRAVPP